MWSISRERKKPGLKQKELFAPPPDPIVEALRALDVDGLSPREALALLRGIAKEGIAAMEVVEVAPPYDISDITALLAVRAMMDTLATMVKYDRIGGKLEA